MSRWKAPVAGICFCFLVVIALLTILFVVMNRHPEKNVDISSTDMILLDRVSSVWCGWQEVSSSHPITVYRITGEPTHEKAPSVNYHLNYNIKLRWGKEKELKYFLLSGSSVEIRACSSRSGVLLRIFQGVNNWRKCQLPSRKSPFRHDVDSSFSEETSEGRSVKYALEEFLKKKVSRRGWYPPECQEVMQSHEIQSDKRKCKRSMFSLRVDHPGTYVFSLQDYHSATDESETDIKLLLNRTRYGTERALVVCRSAISCDVPLSFGSDERSLVFAEDNAGASSTHVVVAKCKPRVFFFILLFAFIPLLLLLCIGCVVFCFCKRTQTTPKFRYTEVKNNEPVNRPSLPLLSGTQVTIYSRAEIENRPPCYRESTAPPPYTPASQVSQFKNKQNF